MYWPLQENFLHKKDINKLCNFIKKNKRFTQFKKVKEFEDKFSRWNKSKYSVFVNSGSSANLLIIQSAKEFFNWKNNDEVIVPAVTWPTTITPVIQSGLKPIFVDVNLNDFSFDYDYRDTFAFNYGDKTETGDMPTSGSANYGIAGQLIFRLYESPSSIASLISEGTGSLTANFSSNSISGSLDFTRYYNYLNFLQAGATSQTQILGVPTATINFFDGSISGNHFTTSTSVSSSGLSGSGASQGSFFGPDGQETSGTFLVASDFITDNSGLDFWEMVGTFFGTCKPNNC